jgi:hypothetical protein
MFGPGYRDNLDDALFSQARRGLASVQSSRDLAIRLAPWAGIAPSSFCRTDPASESKAAVRQCRTAMSSDAQDNRLKRRNASIWRTTSRVVSLSW